MKAAALQHIQVRLFLHAVFPALDDVIKASPKAQALLEGRGKRFSVCFKTRSGVSASYFFSHEGCEYLSSGGSTAGIELLFLSDGHAASTFLEKPALPPIPLKGFSGLNHMKTFTALTDEMRNWLKPTEEQLAEEAFRSVFVSMTLQLAMRAVVQLGRFERRTHDLVVSGPQGLAAFQLGDDGEPVWIRLSTDQMECGRGKLPGEPDTRVIFHDSMVAAQALQDKVDSMAAVGRGQIEVRGMAPLADHLNYLMEQVQPYLESEDVK